MYEKRVARGAKWLDKVRPGWHNKVDPDLLSLTNSYCVIGQAMGNFERVMCQKFFIPRDASTARFLLWPGSYLGLAWTLVNGFVIAREYCEPAWKEAWTKEIMKRRKGDRPLYVPAEWEERNGVLS